MLEVVQIYLDEQKTIVALDVQSEILDSYERDMTKYADNSLSNRIISAFDSIPVQLAKNNPKFQYKVISRASFKLYMSDVGLFVNKATYPLYQIDLNTQPTMIAMGPLTEHYVANELKVKGYENI